MFFQLYHKSVGFKNFFRIYAGVVVVVVTISILIELSTKQGERACN
jgi:hypothetical protein